MLRVMCSRHVWVLPCRVFPSAWLKLVPPWVHTRKYTSARSHILRVYVNDGKVRGRTQTTETPRTDGRTVAHVWRRAEQTCTCVMAWHVMACDVMCATCGMCGCSQTWSLPHRRRRGTHVRQLRPTTNSMVRASSVPRGICRRVHDSMLRLRR